MLKHLSLDGSPKTPFMSVKTFEERSAYPLNNHDRQLKTSCALGLFPDSSMASEYRRGKMTGADQFTLIACGVLEKVATPAKLCWCNGFPPCTAALDYSHIRCVLRPRIAFEDKCNGAPYFVGTCFTYLSNWHGKSCALGVGCGPFRVCPK